MPLSRRGCTLSVLFFLWFSAVSATVPVSSAADPIYKYTDDSGTQNFTTELYSIPEKYRSRVVPSITNRIRRPHPSSPVNNRLHLQTFG